MTEDITADLCVIGAGSGGLSMAAAAAAFGVSVVLVERGRMGGDCLNTGCVPSKALIAAGKAAHAVRRSAEFGVAAGEPAADMRKVMAHVHAVIAGIAPNDSVARFTALGVRVIKAEARFIDRRRVQAGDAVITARRFVVATGSSPFVPPIPGLDRVRYLTNESVFEISRLPKRLAVIGGGPIGMELAQAFMRLGSQVVVVEALAALGREDPEMAGVVLARLRAEGLDIREQTRVVAVEPFGRGGVRLRVEDAAGAGTIEATDLLVAVGRKPNIEGLGLDLAGIATARAGITVDSRLRTSNRRVHAIGDVAGGPQFTHVAGYHAGLVARSILFRLGARVDLTAMPRATFTDPELAHVGMGEAEAREKGLLRQVQRWPFAENDRAQAERHTHGLVKIVAGRKGRLLGVTIAGAGASEAIALYALAIAKGMTLRDLAGFVVPYPTMAEAGKRAATASFAPLARKPAVRRLVRFLARFG